MRPRTYAILVAAFVFSVLQAAGQIGPVDDSSSQNEYQLRSGLEYAEGARGPLLADAYLPNDGRVHPAILYIHGGGWRGGDRTQMRSLIIALAKKGYVGLAIDYDIDPVPFPASLNEARKALQFLREHAAELHIDPSRISVAGSSAGGELAALTALAETGTERVRSAIILNGVLDTVSFEDKTHIVRDYLGGACAEKPDACKAASPLANIRPGAPAFFIGHGTADATVPFAQALSFRDALLRAGVNVQLFRADRGPHTYWIKSEFFTSNLAAIERFLSTIDTSHQAVTAELPPSPR